MSTAVAEIEIVASTARLPAALRQATGMVKGFAGQIGGILGGAGRALADIGKRAIGHFVGNLATRGLDLLVEQGHNVLKFEEALVRLGLASRKSGIELRGIGNEARSLSTATGLDAVEVLRGARAYIDLAGAENYTSEKMSLIARAAQASGSDISDMATVVYSLSNALKVTGPELENTIGGLLDQSKSGAIHFSQMAQEMVALAPVFAQFGVKGREGANRLGAALQIVRTGFGSASEAGTGLQRLMRSLPQHAKLFEKNGVQIFKKGSRSELLTLDQIMANIYKSKLRLDRPMLIKAFGRGEAERAYQLFLGDSIEKYHELIEAGRANGTIQEDLATYTTSASGRIAMAVEKMKNAVAVAFTPERVAAFADALTRAATAVMDAAVWFDKHVQVPESEVAKLQQGQIRDEINNADTSLDQQKAIAIAMQNYREGDRLPDVATRAIRATTGRTGEVSESTIRAVGEQLGQEMRAGGAENTISAGMMVHQDENRAAGEAYLKRLGWTPPQLGAGEGPSAVASGEGGSFAQGAVIAEAVRKALDPALREISRALSPPRTATAAPLNVADLVVRSIDNATGRRGKP